MLTWTARPTEVKFIVVSHHISGVVHDAAYLPRLDSELLLEEGLRREDSLKSAIARLDDAFPVWRFHAASLIKLDATAKQSERTAYIDMFTNKYGRPFTAYLSPEELKHFESLFWEDELFRHIHDIYSGQPATWCQMNEGGM